MLFPVTRLTANCFHCYKIIGGKKTGSPEVWDGEGGGESKGRADWTKCQNRLIVFLSCGYFNKSILMIFVISNNLIKKQNTLLFHFSSLNIVLSPFKKR